MRNLSIAGLCASRMLSNPHAWRFHSKQRIFALPSCHPCLVWPQLSADIGFDQYYQAELKGWVLYLEGSTDLSILQAFAHTLGHPAAAVLQRPFVHYLTTNLPNLLQKTDYHILARLVPRDHIDPEVKMKLDGIVAVANRARSKET